MGRPKRDSRANIIYYVLNRANATMMISEKDGDYEAFERVLTEAVPRSIMRHLSYCLIPNHWHAHRHSTGGGHLYQGRLKSFPSQDGEHFYTLNRYVERNALKPHLVQRAQDWRWGSLYRWHRGTALEQEILVRCPGRSVG